MDTTAIRIKEVTHFNTIAWTLLQDGTSDKTLTPHANNDFHTVDILKI